MPSLTATEEPNSSPAAPVLARTSCCWVQAATLANTRAGCAAPRAAISDGACCLGMTTIGLDGRGGTPTASSARRRDDARRTHHGAPSWWARDVEEATRRVREAIARPSVSQPSDLVERLGLEEGRAAMARMVRRYGELLQAWPDLLEAARELRREGVRVAAPVQ